MKQYTEKELQMMGADKLICIILKRQENRAYLMEFLENSVAKSDKMIGYYHEYGHAVDEAFESGCMTAYNDVLFELTHEEGEEDD